MRSSISQIIAAFLLLLTSFAFAEDSTSVTVLTTTRTVYRVVTETHTGTPPAEIEVATTVGTILPTHHTNSTGVIPTVGVPTPTGPVTTDPTGAAANVNVPVAALAGAMLAMFAL